jgi:hypothetical protein
VRLVPLLVMAWALSACTITRRDPGDPDQPHVTVVVCILARCQIERAPPVTGARRPDAGTPGAAQRSPQ